MRLPPPGRDRSSRHADLTHAVRAGEADTEASRAWRTKTMAALNWERQQTDTMGAFPRLGWNDGRGQNFLFTERDWSVSGGLSFDGGRWGRLEDTFGLAASIGGLQAPQRRFLAAGGSGFVLGDGRLNHAPEAVAEACYDVTLVPGLHAALDLRPGADPRFNAARGPVPVGTLRLRAAC
ncbi:carbohydrate porin [Dankookia sp. GCM10030260]|uniref:carbohydrate porin n=1 Tax=Dankookia sp. GCM10030260 TaxID=3273390 RepID=UPI0036086BA0